jgi:crotonobetainyl-CoA:carnitine CoA-transferase CaiB-like acyl-CoA transferase
VFVESYRGHKIADLGMSPEELAARRPGIVYASPKACSHDGPWAEGGGFDMEALCVTGFTTLEGTPEQPKFPPTLVMNDFVAGYLGAAGIQAALIRRATEGGSYEVRVNLARCAMWFNSLGTFDTDAPGTGAQHQPLAPDSITAKPLRGAGPTGPTGAVLRNQALPAGPRYWWCADQASRHGQPPEASLIRGGWPGWVSRPTADR